MIGWVLATAALVALAVLMERLRRRLTTDRAAITGADEVAAPLIEQLKVRTAAAHEAAAAVHALRDELARARDRLRRDGPSVEGSGAAETGPGGQ